MPIIKHKEQRIAVLMDVQNIYHSARNIYKSKANFKEILKTSVADRKLIRAIAYVIRTESGEEQAFFDALTKFGIETKTKDLQIFLGGMKKGDWDVGLTVDAIRLSESVDVIVLITGDGDFVPLVEYLKNNGTQVEVIAFEKSASSKLVEACDDFTDLSQDKKRYLIK